MTGISKSRFKHTVSGHVKDKITGEQLKGTIVSSSELKGVAMPANDYSFFWLTVPEGKYILQVK
ncbi:hypothetical protein CNR22_03905 [Sphingobacteriaceae bacterium]|nr:hypothetical protein CNR22_03905 [Sphingobacteriaceae bacterium]